MPCKVLEYGKDESSLKFLLRCLIESEQVRRVQTKYLLEIDLIENAEKTACELY